MTSTNIVKYESIFKQNIKGTIILYLDTFTMRYHTKGNLIDQERTKVVLKGIKPHYKKVCKIL